MHNSSTVKRRIVDTERWKEIRSWLISPILGVLWTVVWLIFRVAPGTRMQGVPMSDLPPLWIFLLLGALTGVAYRGTRSLRQRSRAGYWLSWTICGIVGVGVFAVPQLFRGSVLTTLFFWVGFGTAAGFGFGAFAARIKSSLNAVR